MKKNYCLKCRRKLEYKEESQWSELYQNFDHYAGYQAWLCNHCQILYLFIYSSGNKDPIIVFHRLKGAEES